MATNCPDDFAILAFATTTDSRVEKGGAMNRRSNCHAVSFSEYLRNRCEHITAMAHRYWRLRGCPEGSPEVDWFRAEAEFDQQFVAQLELGAPA